MAQKKLILGILSTLRSHPPEMPFAGQSGPFAELLTYARRRNITAYVFTNEGFNWSGNQVSGWDYVGEPSQEWQQKTFPLPDIIYNRIPNRAQESQPAMQEFLDLLKKRYGPRFFNPGFLDKWETYRLLSSARHTGCRLPETHYLTGPQTIRQMLARWGDIYLKPRANSLGIGISRVTTSGGKLICHTLTQDNSSRTAEFCNAEELLASLPLWQKGDAYLVQETVQMALYQARPFDIRLLAQKDRRGRWRKTGWAARVAGPGAVTTHVIYGGERMPVSTVLSKSHYSKAVVKANKLAVTLPKIIESAWQSDFGELEMDIAIDVKGRLNLFELNAKPFKFDENMLRAKSLLRLFHYSHYLAGSRPSSNRKRR